jgi:hypothetical protein
MVNRTDTATHVYPNANLHEVSIACPDCSREAAFAKNPPRWTNPADPPRLKKKGHRFRSAYKSSLNARFGRYATQARSFRDLRLPSASLGPEDRYTRGWGNDEKMLSSMHGTILCRHCGCNRAHVLNWPQDAFYQVDIKGNVLWAYSRGHALRILDHIARKDRPARIEPSLRAIPTPFLRAGNRSVVSRKLLKLLRES